jgi:hypothetical protein
MIDGECKVAGSSSSDQADEGEDNTPGNITLDDREVIRKSVSTELAGGNYNIDGYMVRYRKDSSDPFVWLYISKSANIVYKLNGMNANGTFDWIKLENSSKDIHSFDTVDISQDHSNVTFGNILGE